MRNEGNASGIRTLDGLEISPPEAGLDKSLISDAGIHVIIFHHKPGAFKLEAVSKEASPGSALQREEIAVPHNLTDLLLLKFFHFDCGASWICHMISRMPFNQRIFPISAIVYLA